MFHGIFHLWDTKRVLACLSVFVLVLTSAAHAFAAEQWKRYEDRATGLSVRYPSYWGVDRLVKEYDPDLLVTFLAPVTDNWTYFEEPAQVELRAVKTKATTLAEIRGLADGFEQHYLDEPQVYSAFRRMDTELRGRPAVEFRYTMKGEEGETRTVREVWQAVGTLAVGMRFSTFAMPNHRETHYEQQFEGMLGSLIRVHENDSLEPTEDLRSLGGILSNWAEPRTRSNIADHELPRMHMLDGGLSIYYPEEWEVQPVYEDLFSESVSFTSGKRNSLPFTVTVTDFYSVFVANAELFTDRKPLAEKDDSFWLNIATESLLQNYKAHVPEFELLERSVAKIDGASAVVLEYRGLQNEERITRHEVLAVDRRVLYSFVYVTGSEATRTFEKMVGHVRLP